MDVKPVATAQTGETLGSAYVIMATDESALVAARALNATTFHGVLIRVEPARDAAEGAPERPRVT